MKKFIEHSVIILCNLATTMPVQAQVNNDGLVNSGNSCQYKSLSKAALRLATPEEQIDVKFLSPNEFLADARWLQEAQTDFDALPQSTLESKGEEQLKKLISGEQSVNAALLGFCGDCSTGPFCTTARCMWSGTGVSKRCINC